MQLLQTSDSEDNDISDISDSGDDHKTDATSGPSCGSSSREGGMGQGSELQSCMS